MIERCSHFYLEYPAQSEHHRITDAKDQGGCGAASPVQSSAAGGGQGTCEEPGLAHGVTGITGRARGRMMWEELGVTGMLSHIGWAFSTGDEAARQSSPAASCDTADVPSPARHPGAGPDPPWVPGSCSQLPLLLAPDLPHTPAPLRRSSVTPRAASP